MPSYPAPDGRTYGRGMSLHSNLEPVAALVGTWTGSGHGDYPTITAFDYTEEITFADIGKPFLTYQQRTWSPQGNPMHTESGFLRVPQPGFVELILAQPTGQTELAEGRLTTEPAGLQIDMLSRSMNSASAKHVQVTQRRYRLQGQNLETDLAMAAVGQPLVHHLNSRLLPA